MIVSKPFTEQQLLAVIKRQLSMRERRSARLESATANPGNGRNGQASND